MHFGVIIFVTSFYIAATAAEASDVRTERVRFKVDQTSAAIKGRITGRESASYILGAEAGQTMTITLNPSNRQTHFNVYEAAKRAWRSGAGHGLNHGPDYTRPEQV